MLLSTLSTSLQNASTMRSLRSMHNGRQVLTMVMSMRSMRSMRGGFNFPQLGALAVMHVLQALASS